MANIHSTAVVADGATVDASAEIGPYCVIGAQVTLGPRVKLHSHVAVAGNTSIGADTQVFPFASLGHQPQDAGHGPHRDAPVQNQAQATLNHRQRKPMVPHGTAQKTGGRSFFLRASWSACWSSTS